MSDIVKGIVSATQAAAVAAHKLLGTADKVAIDRAATEALRAGLNEIDFRARVAIGEYEKDRSVGLNFDERVGSWSLGPVTHDLAIDPVEGTSRVVSRGPDACCVVAYGAPGCFLSSRVHYMEKLAFGQPLDGLGLNLDTPPDLLVRRCWERLRSKPVILMLHRERNTRLWTALHEAGAVVKTTEGCDIAAAYRTMQPEHDIDLYMGIGGTTEGVLTAALAKANGTQFYGRLWDGGPASVQYSRDQLAAGDVGFVLTGITNGVLASGVSCSAHTGYVTTTYVGSTAGLPKRIVNTYGQTTDPW